MNQQWVEDVYNGLSALQGYGPVMFVQNAQEQELPGDDPKHEPPADIPPPLPQEVPAPQPSGPDIAPYDTPPPADPGLPAPEAGSY